MLQALVRRFIASTIPMRVLEPITTQQIVPSIITWSAMAGEMKGLPGTQQDKFSFRSLHADSGFFGAAKDREEKCSRIKDISVQAIRLVQGPCFRDEQSSITTDLLEYGLNMVKM